MKTDYELIKDFPKVLFEPHYDGRVIERAVKDAHYVGKYGLEINLGEGSYKYERIYKRGREHLPSWFGSWGNALYADKEEATERAKHMREENEELDLKYRVYSAYQAARRAGASLTFDFSKR